MLSFGALLAVSSEPAHAWGGGFGKGPVAQLIEKLELSDTQLSQIADILKANRDQIRTQGQIVGEELKALGDIMHSQQLNEVQVRAAYQNAANAVEELVVLRAKVMAEVKKVLTETQLEILTKSREDGREKLEFGIKMIQFAVDSWIDKHASN
jgi:Spy/CpxP family protein refolding chaperone